MADFDFHNGGDVGEKAAMGCDTDVASLADGTLAPTGLFRDNLKDAPSLPRIQRITLGLFRPLLVIGLMAAAAV